MINKIIVTDLKISFLLIISFCFSQLVNASDDGSMTIYEAEKLALKDYVVEPNTDAFNDSLITLGSDFGSAQLKPGLSGNFDLHLTYVLEGEGNSVFEIYIDDKLVDSWLAKQYGGAYTSDTLKRVVHVSQNIALHSSSTIEIAGYKSEGENCKIDRLGITETTVDNSLCNLVWDTDGSMKSLALSGSELLNTSKSSGVELVVFEGVKLSTSSIDRTVENGQNIQLIKDENYSSKIYSFRVERYKHHVKLRLLNMEGIPKRDRSLGLRLEIPYKTGLSYEVLDDQVEVGNSRNTLTLYWTKLASRDIIPGGYIALYASNDKTEALNEINSTEELELPIPPTEPTNISLSSYKFTENNAVGDSISILTAEDPQGDIASYKLIAGEGDTDNNKFFIENDVLKANSVFDYEAGSLVYIRVQVTDSTSNTYEKAFILAIEDDEGDNSTGIHDVSELQDINIYPNPINSLLNITGCKGCDIEIVSVLGKCIYSGKVNGDRTTINLEQLADGVYFVKISNSNNAITRKIIKQ